MLDILDAATAAALVRELTDTPGHYSFAHALIQHTAVRGSRSHPSGPGPPPGGRGARRPLRRPARVSCRRAGPPLVQRPNRPTCQSPRLLPAGRRRRPRCARPRRRPAATTPRPSTSTHDQTTQIRSLGIDLTIGLGTAQRQTGDAAFRDTLLDAARRAAALGDTERLVTAALANNRGMFSAAGTVDTDRVEILELALDRLPADHPSRALVLAKLCSELDYGSSLERRQALADEAIALARSTGDDATIVRVLNDISYPLSLPQLLEQSLARSAEALERAERVGDPVLLFWAAHDARRTRPSRRRHRRDGPLLRHRLVDRRATRSTDFELAAAP